MKRKLPHLGVHKPYDSHEEQTTRYYGTFWERFMARVIDIWLSLAIVPILINLIMYFAQGQTIGYKLLGLTIRPQTSPTERPGLSELLKRTLSKFFLTLIVAGGITLVIQLLLHFFLKNPLPKGSSWWIFLVSCLFSGIALTRFTMARSHRHESVYDQVSNTIVIKKATSKVIQVFAYLLCTVSSISLLLITYIGSYIFIDLGSHYVTQEPYQSNLQELKLLLASPLTTHPRVTQASLLISYYIDPHTNFGSAYATPKINQDDEEFFEDKELTQIALLHNSGDKKADGIPAEKKDTPTQIPPRPQPDRVPIVEDTDEEEIIEENNAEDTQDTEEKEQPEKQENIQQPVKTVPKQNTQPKEQPVRTSPPTIDEIVIANEKTTTSSLWYMLNLPQVGKVFTHAHSDDDNIITQVHSLFGDQEIRINNEGVFMKDSITPRTKLTTANDAKEEVHYTYSRKALLPLLWQASLEGASTWNKEDVYMFTTTTRESFPIMITQHLGNEPIDEAFLTFYVRQSDLRLIGGSVEITIGENTFEGMLSITYDVEPPKVKSPLSFIKKYIEKINLMRENA